MLQNPNGRDCDPLMKGLHNFYFNNFIEDSVVFVIKRINSVHFHPFLRFTKLQVTLVEKLYLTIISFQIENKNNSIICPQTN